MGNTEGEDIPMSAAEAREARGEYKEERGVRPIRQELSKANHCLCRNPPSCTELQIRSDLKDSNCNIEQLVVRLFWLDPIQTERL